MTKSHIHTGWVPQPTEEEKDRFYEDLTRLQQGRCGICGSHANLVVDHDHETNYVRGFLCVGCNCMEGHHLACPRDPLNPCPICLWRQWPAASYLGRTISYVSGWTNEDWHYAWHWLPTQSAVDFGRAIAVRDKALFEHATAGWGQESTP